MTHKCLYGTHRWTNQIGFEPIQFADDLPCVCIGSKEDIKPGMLPHVRVYDFIGTCKRSRHNKAFIITLDDVPKVIGNCTLEQQVLIRVMRIIKSFRNTLLLAWYGTLVMSDAVDIIMYGFKCWEAKSQYRFKNDLFLTIKSMVEEDERKYSESS